MLENFQWASSEEAMSSKLLQIREELADVFIYSVLMADTVGLEAAGIKEIIMNKLDLNNNKYLCEKAFGKKDKYTEL